MHGICLVDTINLAKDVKARDGDRGIVAYLQSEIKRPLIDHKVLLKRNSFEGEVVLGKIISIEDGFDTGGIVCTMVSPLSTTRLHEAR